MKALSRNRGSSRGTVNSPTEIRASFIMPDDNSLLDWARSHNSLPHLPAFPCTLPKAFSNYVEDKNTY